MTDTAGAPRRWAGDLLGLLLAAVLCLGVAAVGGSIIGEEGNTWYQALRRPPFGAPAWTFAPAWAAVHLLMALAAWRVAPSADSRGGRSRLLAFAVMLGLGLAWPAVFFRFREEDGGLVLLALLCLAATTTLVLFWRADRLAGLMLLPYTLWIALTLALSTTLRLVD
jgi:tryptophan-rich sensory protein